MEPSVDRIAERLRRGASVALAAAGGGDVTITRAVERELTVLGRMALWIDLTGAESGAELGGRLVEGCMAHLDAEELGNLLEQLPARGRIDLEAFAMLLMLPEQVAARSGKRVVAILDGFHQVERAIGFAGLGAVRDALLLRDRTSYFFVGSRRLQALFERPDMPLYGLAEVVSSEAGGRQTRISHAPARPPSAAPIEASAPEDELAAAMLLWSEPPPAPEPEPVRDAWDRLVAHEREIGEREMAEREWLRRLERGDDDLERFWRRGRRRPRR